MFEVESCVRGYHVYGARWTPLIGEDLQCVRFALIFADGIIRGWLPNREYRESLVPRKLTRIRYFKTKLKDSVNDISKVAATAILSLVNIIQNMRASNISARDSLAIGNYAAQ